MAAALTSLTSPPVLPAQRPPGLSRRLCCKALAHFGTLTSFATAMNATAAPATSPATPAPAGATVRPAEIGAELPLAQRLGSAKLRFFGLEVYEASLWTLPGFEPARYEGQAFALALNYARKLEGAAIAERSIAEMRRVGDFSPAQAKTWLALMLQAFPNVAAQDRLTGLHDGQGRVRFFFNGQPTAAIGDAEFARLFFGIWLSPKTSSPALRAGLIGQA